MTLGAVSSSFWSFQRQIGPRRGGPEIDLLNTQSKSAFVEISILVQMVNPGLILDQGRERQVGLGQNKQCWCIYVPHEDIRSQINYVNTPVCVCLKSKKDQQENVHLASSSCCIPC